MVSAFSAEVAFEGCGGGGLGSDTTDRSAGFWKGWGRNGPLEKKTKDYHIPDCVAGGAPLPETAATGVAAELAFGSDVGVASDWFFFLRPKKPRKPFLSWASASGAKSELMISKYASITQ